ncbi:unnamed protein product [Cylicocyclus nassatus]|uniref:Uncharacterized protein n=1 Tax=Cylicocyclus nassatus TaxID=53992 RepID=A0AA36HCV2_CYLNA|nr:unnamed protein product [Cylicocyclus nassatus]
MSRKRRTVLGQYLISTDCANILGQQKQAVYFWLLVSMAFTGCYVRTDPYALTFSYKCRKVMTNTAEESQRQRIQLVIQFSLICAIQFASSACFYILPPLLPNTDLAVHLPMLKCHLCAHPNLNMVPKRPFRNFCEIEECSVQILSSHYISV